MLPSTPFSLKPLRARSFRRDCSPVRNDQRSGLGLKCLAYAASTGGVSCAGSTVNETSLTSGNSAVTVCNWCIYCNGTVTVRSCDPVISAPPPETVTWFVTCDGASGLTLTVTVIGGRMAPPAEESPRVQDEFAHVQPGPVMETSVRDGGRISVTVMS